MKKLRTTKAELDSFGLAYRSFDFTFLSLFWIFSSNLFFIFYFFLNIYDHF